MSGPRSGRLPVLVALILAIALPVFGVHATRAEPQEGSTGPSDQEIAERPLTDADVVQMVAKGRPLAEILRAVSERPVAFDLSTEMIEELRAAGVTDDILEAMKRRQRDATPSRIAAAGPTPGFVALRVVLSPEGDRAGPQALFFPATVADDLAEKLQLGPLAQDRQVKDLAVFLACRSPEHVPGLWRSSSPLGRDFVSMPPHQLIAFQSGAKPVSTGSVPEELRRSFEPRARSAPPPAGWLRFELPPSVSGEIEESTSHNLILGVAVLVGDHYLSLATARADGFKAALREATGAPGTPVSAEPLRGTIRAGGSRGKPFDVRLDTPPAP